MNSNATSCLAIHNLHRPVHKKHNLEQGFPKGAVLLDLLRTLETQLQEKQLLHIKDGGLFNPLWFLAETERNVFLWRRGCSLIQEDEFEFWVDIPALIKKRLQQLKSYDSENPFLNPDWGINAEKSDSPSTEEKYLMSLIDLLEEVKEHVEALSIAGSKISRDLIPSFSEREVVVLPPTVACSEQVLA